MRRPASESRRAWRMHVEARALLTVDEHSLVWRESGECHAAFEGLKQEAAGAIVRVRPPAGASEERVAAVERGLKEVAASVRVERRAASERVVVEATRAVAESSPDARRTIEWMIETVRTGNRELLREKLEEALAAAGI